MSRFKVFQTTIASGNTLSPILQLTGGKIEGLYASVPTSCQVFFQVCWDQTSASFTRVFKTDGTGAWTWSIGSGPGAVSLQDAAVPFPYGRIETSPAQAGIASLAVIVKL